MDFIRPFLKERPPPFFGSFINIESASVAKSKMKQWRNRLEDFRSGSKTIPELAWRDFA
jgi:hypothetical protein